MLQSDILDSACLYIGDFMLTFVLNYQIQFMVDGVKTISRFLHDAWSNFVIPTSYNSQEYSNQHFYALIFNHYNYGVVPDGSGTVGSEYKGWSDKRFLCPKKRVGTDEDFVALNDSLKSLGFTVSHNKNCTAEAIQKLIKQKSSDKTGFTLFVFVLTHGFYGSLAADTKMYDVTNLFKSISKSRRSSTRTKPKVFFIQACQTISQSSHPPRKLSCTPNFRDFFVLYACSPGQAANRDEAQGSWMIQSLCELVNKMRSGDKINILKVTTALTQLIHIQSESYPKNQIPFSGYTFAKQLHMVKVNPTENSNQRDGVPGLVVSDGQGDNANVRNFLKEHDDVVATHGFASRYELPQNHNGIAVVVLSKKVRVGEQVIDDNQHVSHYIQRFKATLQNLGFKENKIFVWKNRPKNKIIIGLQKLKKKIIGMHPECLLFLVAANGKEGYLEASDDSYEMNSLWEKFRDCKGLAGKPKIFIINSDETNYLPLEHEQPQQQQHNQIIRDADFLYAFSTVMKQRSNFKPGGQYHVYLTALLDVIDKMCATSTNKTLPSLVDILTITHEIVKRHTWLADYPKLWGNVHVNQTPSLNCTLTKEIRFPICRPSLQQSESDGESENLSISFLFADQP